MKNKLFTLHEAKYMVLRGQPPLASMKKHHFPDVEISVKKDMSNVGRTLVYCDDVEGSIKVWKASSPHTK